jgi:hypothetical protein
MSLPIGSTDKWRLTRRKAAAGWADIATSQVSVTGDMSSLTIWSSVPVNRRRQHPTRQRLYYRYLHCRRNYQDNIIETTSTVSISNLVEWAQ